MCQFQSDFLFADVELSQGLWKALTAHQSVKENEFTDFIFAFATDENGKTIIGGMTSSWSASSRSRLKRIARSPTMV